MLCSACHSYYPSFSFVASQLGIIAALVDLQPNKLNTSEIVKLIIELESQMENTLSTIKLILAVLFCSIF